MKFSYYWIELTRLRWQVKQFQLELAGCHSHLVAPVAAVVVEHHHAAFQVEFASHLMQEESHIFRVRGGVNSREAISVVRNRSQHRAIGSLRWSEFRMQGFVFAQPHFRSLVPDVGGAFIEVKHFSRVLQSLEQAAREFQSLHPHFTIGQRGLQLAFRLPIAHFVFQIVHPQRTQSNGLAEFAFY